MGVPRPIEDLPTNAGLLALDRQVCFALSVASRAVIGVYRPLLAPYGLTHPQYLVLLALWERSPRSVKALAAALRLDPATLSPLLKRLETLGYLTRTRSTSDERVLVVELTEAGVDLRAEAERIPAAVVERLGVDVPRLVELHHALSAVIAATDTASSSPPATPSDSVSAIPPQAAPPAAESE